MSCARRLPTCGKRRARRKFVVRATVSKWKWWWCYRVLFDKVFPARNAVTILFDLCVWVPKHSFCSACSSSLFFFRSQGVKASVEHHLCNLVEWLDEFIISLGGTSYFNGVNLQNHSKRLIWQSETFSCDANFFVSFILFIRFESFAECSLQFANYLKQILRTRVGRNVHRNNFCSVENMIGNELVIFRSLPSHIIEQ